MLRILEVVGNAEVQSERGAGVIELDSPIAM